MKTVARQRPDTGPPPRGRDPHRGPAPGAEISTQLALFVTVAAASLLACTTPAGGGAETAPVVRPEALLVGPRTAASLRRFPTSIVVADPYARAWDATAAVLASRGFPLVVVARDTGVLTTGWRVTEPNHRAEVGEQPFLGRKVERITVLVRPLAAGTQVSMSSQTALVSPQWSAAGVPPPGQAIDLPSDTVTEYGLLYDVARVLGRPLTTPPDSAYAVGLEAGGVLAGEARSAKAGGGAP